MLGTLLARPKLVLSVVALAVAGGFFAHYKYMQHKIDRLETQKASMSRALQIAGDSLRAEREAVRVVQAERNAANDALRQFRADRQSDAEAVEWAAQPVPAGELARICEALPSLEGCPGE